VKELPKHIEWNNQKFQLIANGYYQSFYPINGRKQLLHRAIYEFHSGNKIPVGYVIHHKDNDNLNNEYNNLEMIKRGIHISRHHSERPEERKREIRNKQSITHSTEKGRKINSEKMGIWWSKAIKSDCICNECKNTYQTYFPERSYFCTVKCRNKYYYHKRNGRR
jgi:hypothetical protein